MTLNKYILTRTFSSWWSFLAFLLKYQCARDIICFLALDIRAIIIDVYMNVQNNQEKGEKENIWSKNFSASKLQKIVDVWRAAKWGLYQQYVVLYTSWYLVMPIYLKKKLIILSTYLCFLASTIQKVVSNMLYEKQNNQRCHKIIIE